MKANLVAIKDCVVKAKTWNPVVEAKDETITYIDIAAVDKDLKKIVEPTLCLGAEAPSRARQLVQTNDVLVSTVRPNLNSVAVVTEEFSGATASTGYTVLRPLPEVLDTQYLFHWVKTGHFINEMIKLATGQSYPAVSDKIILNSKIPLPPLAEQRRIASILDQADVLRQKRQQAIEKLDQLLQATFIDMFGDPISNPKNWNKCLLEKVTHKITDGTHKTPTYMSSGIEFLSAKDIKKGRIVWNTNKYISEQEHSQLIKRCNPEIGDVVLAKSGSLGSVAIIDRSHQFSLFESLCLIKHDRQQIDAIFLTSMLRSPSMLSHLLGKNKGIAIKHLHLVDIRGLEILLPPIELQLEFSSKIGSIDKLISIHLSSLEYIESLFKSLQNQAFNGTL